MTAPMITAEELATAGALRAKGWQWKRIGGELGRSGRGLKDALDRGYVSAFPALVPASHVRIVEMARVGATIHEIAAETVLDRQICYTVIRRAGLYDVWHSAQLARLLCEGAS